MEQKNRKRRRSIPPSGSIDQAELDRRIARLTARPLDNTIDLQPQIAELNQRIEDIESFKAAINTDQNSYRGVRGGLRALLGILQKAVNSYTTIRTAKIDLLQKRLAFAARTVVPSDDGAYAGNGKCYVHFVNVGMGDCTLIATPEGKKIMIDLGSDALSDVILNPDFDRTGGLDESSVILGTIKSKLFLNGEGTLDLLLLTHADGDHHNLLKPLLGDNIQNINMVYYGGATKLSDYTGTSAYLIEKGAGKNAQRVTLREEANQVSKRIVVTKALNDTPVTNAAGKPATLGEEFIDPVTGALVLYYEQSAASDFKISVLSGNVKGVWQKLAPDKPESFVLDGTLLKAASEMSLGSSDVNKASLIVCIECFGEVVLVCGDATTVTEAFATKYFTPLLNRVSYLRMAHHGSPTSSSRSFLNAQSGLKMAVASTGGEKTIKNSLPKKRIMQEYLTPGTRLPKTAAAHTIYSFDRDESPKAQAHFRDITDQLLATGSNDTVQLCFTKPTP